MFVDPEEKKQTAAHLLRRAFGLTAAEANIALSISMGEDLRRAADVNRIAYETARVHLKAIFVKTQNAVRSNSQYSSTVSTSRTIEPP
jgi:DNA-binding CsgD family transcriptional regulator